MSTKCCVEPKSFITLQSEHSRSEHILIHISFGCWINIKKSFFQVISSQKDRIASSPLFKIKVIIPAILFSSPTNECFMVESTNNLEDLIKKIVWRFPSARGLSYKMYYMGKWFNVENIVENRLGVLMYNFIYFIWAVIICDNLNWPEKI